MLWNKRASVMLEGKNFLITGASSGLGAALAIEIAKKKGYLTLCARRVELLKKLERSIVDRYPDAQVVICECDVTDKNALHQAVELSVARFGGLDVFIANAGQSMWSRFSDIEDPDRLKELMDLNYMGVVYSAFYALPYLRVSEGSFIAVSSVQGVIPVPYHSGYVAAKYAVNGFIETLSLEEPKVHFLLALPAWISGTELRSHALMGTKASSIAVKHHHGRSAISAEQCAAEIIAALEQKKTQIFMPSFLGPVPLLRQLFRKTVDNIIQKKVSGQLKSGS
ncbi:MAG TPA: SDR family NAD(P)-dependent oxidoreductase [Myxococcota bacterium]|nr:SDR family NAD(P)-dependent oxidoreductase [Myxococcota bacterium]